jgi:hypothetical protein
MRRQTLLVICLLAVLGVGSLAATRIPEIKSRFFSANSAAALTSATKQTTPVFAESPRRGQMSRADYEREVVKLDSAVLSRDVNILAAAGDEAEKTWGAAGGEQYGRLMSDVSFRLANYFDDFPLSQKYASRALSHADSFSVDLETHLLGFLTRDLSAGASGEDAENAWEKERSAKAKLWLHAWQRLNSQIDRSFDFTKRPSTVMPPEESGLPAGVAPEAIRDPALRAKYKEAIDANVKLANTRNHQLKLRELDRGFPKNAEDYLIKVYSQSPNRIAQLREYLGTYGIDRVTSKRIVSEVEKRIRSAQ